MVGKQNSTVLVLISITIAIIGFVLGYFFGIRDADDKTIYHTATEQDVQDTFDAGWKAAKEKVEDSGLLRVSNVPVTSLRGTVTNVNGTSFTLNSQFQVRNPLEELPPEERIVIVDENTQVIKRIVKEREQLLAEREQYKNDRKEYQEQLLAGERVSVPIQPSRYKEDPSTILDINEGATVIILSKDQTDISYEETIMPEIIYILEGDDITSDSSILDSLSLE